MVSSSARPAMGIIASSARLRADWAQCMETPWTSLVAQEDEDDRCPKPKTASFSKVYTTFSSKGSALADSVQGGSWEPIVPRMEGLYRPATEASSPPSWGSSRSTSRRSQAVAGSLPRTRRRGETATTFFPTTVSDGDGRRARASPPALRCSPARWFPGGRGSRPRGG